MNQTKLLQYALLGTAFVISKLDEKTFENIRGVYIFGSVSRKSANEDSDIDVFFDTDTPTTRQHRIRKRIAALYGQFRLSIEGLLLRSQGIENNFAPIVGKFEEWTDLKRTIAVAGIQVYGAAQIEATGRPWLIISWEKAKNRGAFLNAVYGYRAKEKKYAGLLQKLNGLKLGKSTVAIPTANKQAFNKLLEKYEVQYQIHEFLR